MKYEAQIEAAAEHFKKLLAEQLERVDRINAAGEAVDYSKKDQIVIGICGDSPRLREEIYSYGSARTCGRAT